MVRRWSIPLTTVLLALGVMGLAGNASASVAHHAGPGGRPAIPRSIRPGGVIHTLPGGIGRSSVRGIDGYTDVASSNWSGYAATGSNGAFTSVSSSWTEPTGTCSGKSDDQYAAFWVGLDGFSSDSVEQTGTLIWCDRGTAEYYGWYEMYPAALDEYSNTVRPGDAMSASVVFSGSDTYTLTLTDSTRNWTEKQVINESGLDRSSAEVITEAPCCTNSGGILPLADFGTVKYGASDANGASLDSQSSLYNIIIENNSGEPEDSTSAIASNGSFGNTWIRT